VAREPGSFALTAEEAVALVERALAEPLPAEHLDHAEYDARGFGGEGRRGLRLAMSGSFWDDVDRIDAEYELMEAREAAFLDRFAVRHGAPTDLAVVEWDERGVVLRHPLGADLGTRSVRVWRLEERSRFVALYVSHLDKELPVELSAVVGDLGWLDAARPWRRGEEPGPSLSSADDVARPIPAPRPADSAE
jgi:hypothetical protein